MLIKPEEIITKSSIKKHYGQKLKSDYPKELIDFEQEILIENVKILQTIWDYISIDLIRNHIDSLEIVSLPIEEAHIEWLKANIKLESFLNMVTMHYQKVGCIEIDTFIKDTFNQLKKLLEKNVSVKPPKRWRLTEFHDHVSYLYLEHTTQNNVLKTIIEPYSVDDYTVSQPPNSLSIIIWGKKVKNCVASYEERIGKSIWIFFIEKDGVPLYTVETDMSKDLHIRQIVSQCNGRVDDEGRALAHKLIMEAFKQNK